MSGSQTIFALSSGKLPSGVAVIRVSGARASHCVAGLTGSIPEPRKAVLRDLLLKNGQLLDTALVLWFPSPASFTGEDCAEFQVHGGPAVVAALLDELSSYDSCRLADAGEFSLRAFINGKADLTQMEALADLISAETEAQRALAVIAAGGLQRQLYENWRADLLKARAFLEADLDFSDEDDVPGSVADAASAVVMKLIDSLDTHLMSARNAEIIRDGFRVVIAGAPNAGKSTLLNTLARRDVAIVTDIAGTTRDVLEVALDIDGVKVVLSDTAGLRQTTDIIEQIGIGRAHLAIESADLILLLSDGSLADDSLGAVGTAPALTVRTKCDNQGLSSDASFDLQISCHTGLGIDRLIAAIGRAAKAMLGHHQDGAVVMRARHVALLRDARAALMRFPVAGSVGPEFAAEELRVAGDALGRITGIISTEDVLGAIFSSFCIGK